MNIKRFDLVWMILIQATAIIFLTVSYIYSTITNPPWFVIFIIIVVYASMILFYLISVNKSNVDKETRLNERSYIIISNLLEGIENKVFSEEDKAELEKQLKDLFTIHFEEL